MTGEFDHERMARDNLMDIARLDAKDAVYLSPVERVALDLTALTKFGTRTHFVKPKSKQTIRDRKKCGGCARVFIADEEKDQCPSCAMMFCAKCAVAFDFWGPTDEEEKKMEDAAGDDFDLWMWMPGEDDAICVKCQKKMDEKMKATLAKL